MKRFGPSDLAALSADKFFTALAAALSDGGRAAAYFASPAGGGRRLCAAVAHDRAGRLDLLLSEPLSGGFPSLTPRFPQLHLFEREICELSGLRPEGHPWLKPVRYPAGGPDPGTGDFFRVHGPEVHEVAVGPVHAGVIEPGHFRFQCHGENVFHLEIALGYQHRGVERALSAGPDARSIHYAETLAGDTTVGHAWAYCGAVEALAGCAVPPRAQALRGILLELERLANHTGDLGALSGDVAYLPTASFCGRLRGDYLNMTALVCGNRFGRNALRPGGVNFDLEPGRAAELLRRLDDVFRDTGGAVSLLWDTASVTERFEGTGPVSRADAAALGLVGPAARASGVDIDTRRDFPYGPYNGYKPPQPGRGDVYARAHMRWEEIVRSVRLIGGWVAALPDGPLEAPCGAPAPDSAAVSLVEGWRGQICHAAFTGPDGKFLHYKVVDPSFHNWQGLAMALRGGQVSDFPLCNKSFNLSYCGHDL